MMISFVWVSEKRFVIVISFINFYLYLFFLLKITESDKNNGGSELLPTNWNQNQSVYSLKYHSVKPDKLNLLLKGVVAGDRFIISLLVRSFVENFINNFQCFNMYFSRSIRQTMYIQLV